MKKIVGILVIVAVGAGVYWYTRSAASERVKREALKMADIMDLSGEQRSRMQRLIKTAHEQAFTHALHATGAVGGKFDGQAYYDELCRLVIDQARGEGRDALADSIAEEKKRIRFSVVER